VKDRAVVERMAEVYTQKYWLAGSASSATPPARVSGKDLVVKVSQSLLRPRTFSLPLPQGLRPQQSRTPPVCS